MRKRQEAALRVKPFYQKGAQTLSDSEALEVKGIYPTWRELIGSEATVGMKFTHEGVLYKVIQAHTFQENWIPGIDTASLYTRIDEEHKGTFDDPIPYASGMVLVQGLYYEQYDVIYYCTYGSVNAVFSDLKDLVPLYVEVADDEDKQTSWLLEDKE